MAKKKKAEKVGYMISAVAEKYSLHPQTLRLYERVGLLRPSRSEGNTRLYTEEDLERLEVVLAMTRELGVNLAGVEVILNMREKMERLQEQVEDFVGFVNAELERMRDRSMQERFRNALVRVGPRARPPAPAEETTSQAKVKA
ncbi:MAG: helix-turn-helix transcriptional regulator [Acidobacteria bacterium]|nr:helix-turn-helix transcriptional regulator [Acidobacteriota bacterium]MCH7985694.1 helix-turn-helix transcriptional regulator [Acidobacteriota bacterium]